MVRSKYGIIFEREVARKQREFGIGVRIAASGTAQPGSPDVIVGQEGRAYAMECKYTSSNQINISGEQHDLFNKFAEDLGATAMYIVKFRSRGVYMYRSENYHFSKRGALYLKYGFGTKIDLNAPVKTWEKMSLKDWY